MADKPNAAGERNATFYDRAGNRWYRPIPNNPSKTFMGVTSILNSRNKKGLEIAKRNGIINYVADNREQLASLNKGVIKAVLKDQDEILPDWTVGRNVGTAVHTTVENILLGEDPSRGVLHVEGTPSYPVSNDWSWVEPRVKKFISDYDVKILGMEETVVSEKHRYAGSFDLLCEMDDVRGSGKRMVTLVDWKSNRKAPSSDVALQLAAYARADYIIDTTTGETRDMPKVEQNVLVWMSLLPPVGSSEPGGNVHPLRYDDEVWRAFYAHLVLAGYNVALEDTMIEQAVDGPERWKRYTRG